MDGCCQEKEEMKSDPSAITSSLSQLLPWRVRMSLLVMGMAKALTISSSSDPRVISLNAATISGVKGGNNSYIIKIEDQ